MIEKPRFRIVAEFTPSESHYAIVGEPKPSYTFDSDVAYQAERLVTVDYGESMNSWNPRHGRFGGSYQTYYGQMELGGNPLGPRVRWREYKYGNSTQAMTGRIANEHLDPMYVPGGGGKELPPLGRQRGALSIQVNGVTVAYFPGTDPTDSFTFWDKSGCAFSFGQLKPMLKMEPFLRQVTLFQRRTPKKNLGLFRPEPAPDLPGGVWLPQFTAHDPKQNPENYPPEFVEWVKKRWVANWYEGQTHKAGSWRNEHFDRFLSCMWQLSLDRWANEWEDEDDQLEMSLLTYAPGWAGSQWGEQSPLDTAAQARCMDGRPAGLFLRNGEPWRAGVKYNLWKNDQAKPRTCVMIEGLELEKGSLAITEMNGRDLLPSAEKAAGRFEGRYQRKNGWDWEHCEIRKLLSIAIITADMNAIDNLHFILEGILSNPIPHHSTRVWGLTTSALLGGWNFFRSDKLGPYQQDSIRYLHQARKMLETAEKDTIRRSNGYPHPYEAFYSRGWANISKDKISGGEAIGMLGQALWACLEGMNLDLDPTWKARWYAMAKYCVKCFMQPGIYDLSRGGIIDTYPLIGPYPAEGQYKDMTVGERLELRAKDQGSASFDRSMIDWQGTKMIPSIAWYWTQTHDPDLPEELVLELWNAMGNRSVGGKKMLSTTNPFFWGEGHVLFQALGQPPGVVDLGEGLEGPEGEEAPTGGLVADVSDEVGYGNVKEFDPAYSNPEDASLYE